MIAAMSEYPRLDWTPHWRMLNENLAELVDLFGERLSWTPRQGEWDARTVFAHIIWGRTFGPHFTRAPLGWDAINSRCEAGDAIKEQLRESWQWLEPFLSDQAKLDAVYSEWQENDPYYNEPDLIDGHYWMYHRFAHELHHRSTLIGYLNQLGVPLDGQRLRPL